MAKEKQKNRRKHRRTPISQKPGSEKRLPPGKEESFSNNPHDLQSLLDENEAIADAAEAKSRSRKNSNRDRVEEDSNDGGKLARRAEETSVESSATTLHDVTGPVAGESILTNLDAKRASLIKEFSRYLESVAGLGEPEFIAVGEEIEARCMTYFCVLQKVGSNGEPVGKKFTLRAGPKRPGQKPIVRLVYLDQKTDEAKGVENLPRMTAIPVEDLPGKDQEAVVRRWSAKLQGRRTGGKNLTVELRKKGAAARVDATSAEERSEFGRKGGLAAAAARRQ